MSSLQWTLRSPRSSYAVWRRTRRLFKTPPAGAGSVATETEKKKKAAADEAEEASSAAALAETAKTAKTAKDDTGADPKPGGDTEAEAAQLLAEQKLAEAKQAKRDADEAVSPTSFCSRTGTSGRRCEVFARC